MPKDIYIRQERRPIVTKTEKGWIPAIFHVWGTNLDGETVAVYEFEDGTCSTNNVWSIRFLDTEPEGWMHFKQAKLVSQFEKEKKDAGAE
mgnify:CR=1 FL=1